MVAAGVLEVNNGLALGAFSLGENVLASYESVLVTLETEGAAPEAPSDQLIYSGTLSADLRAAVLDLFSSTGPLPNGLAQLELAVQHATFAQEELAAGIWTVAASMPNMLSISWMARKVSSLAIWTAMACRRIRAMALVCVPIWNRPKLNWRRSAMSKSLPANGSYNSRSHSPPTIMP